VTDRALPSVISRLDANHPYRLEELIDLAERNNPQTRIAWEAARQSAARLGIDQSAYYPHLAALALIGDQRLINPFPKPLAPRGYVMVEIPIVQAGMGLEYTVFDFGRRSARREEGKSLRLAAIASFQQVNQDVAYRVVTAYYNLVTAQEHLEAARQIVKTAATTQQAAEAQLANGRATLPDILNAKAAAAQASYDLESSIGDEANARVALREVIGVEPSDQISIQAPSNVPIPSEVTSSVAALVDAARQMRPDLEDLSQRLHAANAELSAARAEQRPNLQLDGYGEQSAIWPTTDYGTLGNANQTVWSVGLKFQWSVFDGGQRRNEVRLAESKRRETEEVLREKQDSVAREVWSASVRFHTAVSQFEAAEILLTSAQTSYDASLDAYKYGVKNLVDLVAAETQLAQARLAYVQSHSNVSVSAINLDYRTGNILRPSAPVAEPSTARP
jgi:outer membrane protein TolC